MGRPVQEVYVPYFPRGTRHYALDGRSPLDRNYRQAFYPSTVKFGAVSSGSFPKA